MDTHIIMHIAHYFALKAYSIYFILPLILKLVFIIFLTISYQLYTGKVGWA